MANHMIFGEGSEADSHAIKLATKKGRWIRNVRRKERAPEALRAAVSFIRRDFPALTLRSISATYNCFGMVFACRRTCIIDENEVLKILEDDGYIKVSSRSAVEIGDIIIYRQVPPGEIRHVGVITERLPSAVAGGEPSFMVLSQWGADGEWVHPEGIIRSLLGNEREFYSERKQLGSL